MAFKDFLFFWKTREINKDTYDSVIYDYESKIMQLREALRDPELTTRRTRQILEEIQDNIALKQNIERLRDIDRKRKEKMTPEETTEDYTITTSEEVNDDVQTPDVTAYDNDRMKDITPHPALKEVTETETEEKDFGTGNAGPVPNSLLAEQDLEGSTSTEKAAKKLDSFIFKTHIKKSQYEVSIKFTNDESRQQSTTLKVDADSEEQAKTEARKLFDRNYPSQGGYSFRSITSVSQLNKSISKLDAFIKATDSGENSFDDTDEVEEPMTIKDQDYSVFEVKRVNGGYAVVEKPYGHLTRDFRTRQEAENYATQLNRDAKLSSSSSKKSILDNFLNKHSVNKESKGVRAPREKGPYQSWGISEMINELAYRTEKPSSYYSSWGMSELIRELEKTD